MKIEWHQDLKLSDKLLRVFICLFCSFVASYFIVVGYYLYFEIAPKINAVTFILFFIFSYFSFKKVKMLPPPDKNMITPKLDQNWHNNINNPSNPYAYTTPGGIGFSERKNSFDHARSRNSDFYNYYNR